VAADLSAGPDERELRPGRPVQAVAVRPGDNVPGAEPAEQAANGPGLRERQLAEHSRYRQVVEASVHAAAARDAWTSAVPALRAEWEAHRERYPGHAREAASTQPDGSWHGDAGRRLSPEQNAEADKCAADLRDEARQTIRPAIERVAAADPGRQLAGLEHMLKGEDRLKEKIADQLTAKPGQDVRSALDKVADAVRFTLIYPPERYAEGVLRDIDRLKEEGLELIKLKNFWRADQYKGVNSQWRVPDTGTRLEMQFHTTESLAAKELTHEAYERIRSAAALPARERDFAEERALEDFQLRTNDLLITPTGTEVIHDFPQTKEKNGG
jgi:hypothetical protein